MVIGHLLANADHAREIVARAVDRIPGEPGWPEHHSLDDAIITERSLWPEETARDLSPILKRFLEAEKASR